MNIKEFRESGYLQEANRRFFHPLGLALEIVQQEDGTETLGGIWDYREDKEGILYDIAGSDSDRKGRFKANEDFINSEFETRKANRLEALGFIVEPIPNK